MSERSSSSGNTTSRYRGPTPTLPLLHALLRLLSIPILPPTLSSTSPSLLLILLETILATRLPLPPSIRSCSTLSDEISVIKFILGVLAHDILILDLAGIDPVKVVAGATRELEVVVMALAVVAKRSGLVVRVPSPVKSESEEDWDASLTGDEDLCPPIRPDLSFSSSGPLSPPSLLSTDVFGIIHDRARPSSSVLFERGDEDSGIPGVVNHRESSKPAVPSPKPPWSKALEEESSFVMDRLMPDQAMQTETSTGWTPPVSFSTRGNKTVFQQISEELGLGL